MKKAVMILLAVVGIYGAQAPVGQSDDNLRYISVQASLVSCQANGELQGRELAKLKKELADLKAGSSVTSKEMSKPEAKTK